MAPHCDGRAHRARRSFVRWVLWAVIAIGRSPRSNIIRSTITIAGRAACDPRHLMLTTCGALLLSSHRVVRWFGI